MQTIGKTGRTLAAMAGVATLAAVASWGFGVLDVRAPGAATLNGGSSLTTTGSAAVVVETDTGLARVGYMYPQTPIACLPYPNARPVAGDHCSTGAAGSGATIYGTMYLSNGGTLCRCVLQ